MNLEVLVLDQGRLVSDVRQSVPYYDWVIIDGPPGISSTGADAVRTADLVLIPAKASPFDVWAAPDIVEAVKARQQTSGSTPAAAFVITLYRPRTMLRRQIQTAREEYGLLALESRTAERVSYPQMVIERKSVLDGRDVPPRLRSSL